MTNTMKTIREWFEESNEPWAKEAINLTSEANKSLEAESLSVALRKAFAWGKSGDAQYDPENFERWYAIYKPLQRQSK